MAKTHLYILKYRRRGFAKPCYKVGITDDPLRRRSQHEAPGGLTGWTKTLAFDVWVLHDPERAGETELRATLDCMARHGFDYVRGANFDHRNQAGIVDAKNVRDVSKRFNAWVRSACQLAASMNERCYRCHGHHLSMRCPVYKGQAHVHKHFCECGIDDVPGSDVHRWGTHVQTRDRLRRLARKLAWWSSSSDDAESPTHRYNLRPRAR